MGRANFIMPLVCTSWRNMQWRQLHQHLLTHTYAAACDCAVCFSSLCDLSDCRTVLFCGQERGYWSNTVQLELIHECTTSSYVFQFVVSPEGTVRNAHGGLLRVSSYG